VLVHIQVLGPKSFNLSVSSSPILTSSSSADTYDRVKRASIEALTTDISLVSASDYILSIVPPRDALATAKRISAAFAAQTTPKAAPLYYLDLNAISPRSAREIAELFAASKGITLIDGGIIGSPPSLKAEPDKPRNNNVTSAPEDSHAWNRPSIPTSGPAQLADAPVSGAHLSEILNVRHISADIGAASGLKCCFATTTKGATALMIQAFTTASRMGVLSELQEEMSTRIPAMWKFAQGVTHVPPKAYRWVREMEEISVTHAEDGGFEGGGKGIFDAVAEVYRTVADDTVLGEEKTERRKRGLTVEDVAVCVSEGLAKKQKKEA
jgi:hypothetical protein